MKPGKKMGLPETRAQWSTGVPGGTLAITVILGETMEDTGLIRHGDQSGGNSSKDFRKTRKAFAFVACLYCTVNRRYLAEWKTWSRLWTLPCTKLGYSGEAEWEVGSGRGITHQERVCLYEGDLGIFITRDVYVMLTQRQRKPPFINHY